MMTPMVQTALLRRQRLLQIDLTLVMQALDKLQVVPLPAHPPQTAQESSKNCSLAAALSLSFVIISCLWRCILCESIRLLILKRKLPFPANQISWVTE